MPADKHADCGKLERVTTAQPGRNTEDFLRDLLKTKRQDAENVSDATHEDDDQQQDAPLDDDGDS